MPVRSFGPRNARLEVHTHREGAASRVGHDLVLEVGKWWATLERGDRVRIELAADPGSLRVAGAHGGVTPLTDRDRRQIAERIGKILGPNEIRFHADGLESGELTLVGQTRPLAFAVDSEDPVSARATVTQSDFGIKPYRAMLGQLRVADQVEVVLST
jgi:hypothetical protein